MRHIHMGSGFLNPSTLNTQGWIILAGSLPVAPRTLAVTPQNYQMSSKTKSLLPSRRQQPLSQVTKKKLPLSF